VSLSELTTVGMTVTSTSFVATVSELTNGVATGGMTVTSTSFVASVSELTSGVATGGMMVTSTSLVSTFGTNPKSTKVLCDSQCFLTL